MINTQLFGYVKQQLSQGLSREVIQQNLISAGGWSPSDITEVFLSIENTKKTPDPSGRVSVSPEIQKTSSRGLIFMLIIVFGVVVIGVGVYLYSKNKNLANQSVVADLQKVSNNDSMSVGTSLATKKDKKFQSHTIATIPSDLYTKVGRYLEERIVFDGDGESVMYLARNNDIFTATSSNFFIIKNEESLGEFIEMSAFETSADGHDINWAALRKTGTSTSEMIINGIVQSYDGRPAKGTKVVFSDDGKHYAYVQYYQKGELALIYDNRWLYKGGIPVESNKGLPTLGSNVVLTTGGSYVAFSPTMVMNKKGNGIALISQKGAKKQIVVINPIIDQVHFGALHEDILSPVVFSSDLKHYAYRAQDEGKEFVILDGKQQTSFQKSGVAWSPAFSLDGKKVSYAVTNKITKAMDISTGYIVPYTQEDFLTKTARAAIPNMSDLGSAKSAPIFDDAGKNYTNIVYDFETSEKMGAELKILLEKDPEQAKKEMKKFDTPFYLEVNGIKIDRLFGFISAPKFDPTGKYVMFGAREGKKLQWLVYEIVGNKLIEKI